VTIDGLGVQIDASTHEAALARLSPGDRVLLIEEPTNRKTSLAVLLADERRVPLGYLPDLLTEDFHRLGPLSPKDCTVIQVNGPDAPPHMRLLLELSIPNAQRFEFFSGPRWQLMTSDS
jgi:hypothetical protein